MKLNYLAAITHLEFNPVARFLALTALFIFALGILGLGTNEHTGVTGKDEYYLSLRVPLCMQEQQVWLVPCLDGEPRLRKPPLLYWFTRASLQLFGISLGSARLVAVVFASLLVLAIAILAIELGDGLLGALTAGVIALSCLGLAVGGRILELDIPVATWSTWSYLWFVYWSRRDKFGAAMLAACCLAAGFLTKGPIVLIVCGSGVLALLLTDHTIWGFLRRHWWLAISIMLLATALALPWFLYVQSLYPDASAAIFKSELAARQFPYFSLVPVYGLLLLAMPWGFVAVNRILCHNSYPIILHRPLRMRILWLVFTLLPFFLVRTFERYLIGSLVPLSLLLALPMEPSSRSWRWTARLGLLVTLPVALAVQGIALILNGTAWWLVVTTPATIWCLYQWWQAQYSGQMALAAAVLWASILGLVYPRLGINQIPTALLEQVRGREVVLFNGPQPALLPAMLGRSLVHVDASWHLPERLHQPCSSFMLLSEESQVSGALVGVAQLGLTATEIGHFGIFSSKVTWANMLRPGHTMTGLFAAIQQGELNKFKPQVVLYQVDSNCQLQP